MQKTKDLRIVGTIARFKPVHKNHASMLISICKRVKHVYIGLGSVNCYDMKNPFTAKESADMVRLVLKDFSNYSFIEVPDFWDGPKWRGYMLKSFGKLSHFVVANEYVVNLLQNDYNIIHPSLLVPKEKMINVNATMVRIAMAKGEHWEHLVPKEVVDYIKQNQLDKRFRKEFGKETLKFTW